MSRALAALRRRFRLTLQKSHNASRPRRSAAPPSPAPTPIAVVLGNDCEVTGEVPVAAAAAIEVEDDEGTDIPDVADVVSFSSVYLESSSQPSNRRQKELGAA